MIKARIEKTAAVLLILAALLPLISVRLPDSAAFEDPVSRVRIGLSWGGNSTASANLLNFVGSGYDFGYFDGDREFIKLGETDKTAITMMKDWNMYRYSGAWHDSAPASGSAICVGCYHLRLEPAYESAEALREAMYDADGNKIISDSFAAYHNGEWYICAGDYTSLGAAESALSSRGLNGSAMTASSRCVTAVETETGEILFQFDCGEDRSLAVMPKADEGEDALTWYHGYKYYGGFQYTRLDGGDLTVVNFVGMSDYVKGVIPYEMTPSWPIEALKAQAVTARTYAAAHLNAHRKNGFDLCDDVCCQTYRGANSATDVSDRAVEETDGVYLTYEGDYANTFYYSSNGGATEDCQNVFYEDIPYLKGKHDPYEDYVETGYKNWSYTYTAAEITGILQAKGYACASIVSVTPTYTPSGNIYSIKFTDANGVNWTFSKDRAGSILYSSSYGKYTFSQHFTVTDGKSSGATEIFVNTSADRIGSGSGRVLYAINGDGIAEELQGIEGRAVITSSGVTVLSLLSSGEPIYSDKYVVTGSGWGHNVGMSQYGAKAMAELGYGYEDILDFYYTGASIG
ncbi:MAG: SpoIID/LytB domain-containing protein [Oscillospiraceae bacterium]|jgi:stage II sporulation protein D|nr:SpoIID/LytB domain-containing protein [Oscillospiraceae bacterium]